MPTIVEKYFNSGNFADREREVLEAVCKHTGFKPEKELFRGTIYDKSKLGSVILLGSWKDRRAVLKLQGLNVEVDEGDTLKRLTEAFGDEYSPRRVQVPEVYVNFPWDSTRQYGYLIMEYIEARPVFAMPDASSQEMRRFAELYDVYRSETNLRIHPWIERPEVSTFDFVIDRTDHWQEIRESRPGNDPSEYEVELHRFDLIAKGSFYDVPLVFCHGHLTPNDLLTRDGRVVLLSNLYWTWRPELYDAVFAIWACLLRLKRPSDTADKAIDMVERWFAAYNEHSASFRSVPNVRRRFDLLMLERTIGILLADLALHDKFLTPEGSRERSKLLEINKAVFAHFARRLEKGT